MLVWRAGVLCGVAVSLGNNMGILWVRFMNTIPVPLDTAPSMVTSIYCTINATWTHSYQDNCGPIKPVVHYQHSVQVNSKLHNKFNIRVGMFPFVRFCPYCDQELFNQQESMTRPGTKTQISANRWQGEAVAGELKKMLALGKNTFDTSRCCYGRQ
jgi:hypothetical protein